MLGVGGGSSVSVHPDHAKVITMSILRKFGLGFAGLILSLAIGLFLASLSVTPTLLDREVVKGWFKDSSLYDNLQEQAVSATIDSLEEETALLNSETIAPALKAALTTDFIREQTEATLDSAYDWMSGYNSQPQLIIDLSSRKDAFYAQLRQTIEPKIQSLPTCTAFDDQNTESVTQLRCLPVGNTPAGSADEIARQVTDGAGFEKLNSQPIDGTSESAQNATTTSIDILNASLWVAPLIALLAVLAMLFIAEPHSKGLRSIGVNLTTSGGLTLILSLVGLFTASEISFGSLANDLSGINGDLITSFDKIIQSAIIDISRWLAIGSGIITVLGIIALVIASRINRPKLDLTDLNNQPTVTPTPTV